MPDRIKTGQTFFQRYVSTLFGTDPAVRQPHLEAACCKKEKISSSL